MATSRKDYVAVAETITRALARADETRNPNAAEIVAFVARAMADHFARDNGAFNRQRFYRACGLTEAGEIRA